MTRVAIPDFLDLRVRSEEHALEIAKELPEGWLSVDIIYDFDGIWLRVVPLHAGESVEDD